MFGDIWWVFFPCLRFRFFTDPQVTPFGGFGLGFLILDFICGGWNIPKEGTCKKGHLQTTSNIFCCIFYSQGKLSRVKGQLGAPPTVYPWYLLCLQGFLGVITHKYPLFKAYIGISLMGTLVGVHPTIPWSRNFWLTEIWKSWQLSAKMCKVKGFWCKRRVVEKVPCCKSCSVISYACCMNRVPSKLTSSGISVTGSCWITFNYRL